MSEYIYHHSYASNQNFIQLYIYYICHKGCLGFSKCIITDKYVLRAIYTNGESFNNANEAMTIDDDALYSSIIDVNIQNFPKCRDDFCNLGYFV